VGFFLVREAITKRRKKMMGLINGAKVVRLREVAEELLSLERAGDIQDLIRELIKK